MLDEENARRLSDQPSTFKDYENREAPQTWRWYQRQDSMTAVPYETDADRQDQKAMRKRRGVHPRHHQRGSSLTENIEDYDPGKRYD